MANLDQEQQNSFWGTLKLLRKKRKFTQQQVAEETGCSRQELSLMENGRFKGGFRKVERVFAFLGAPLQPGNSPMSHSTTTAYSSKLDQPVRILAIDDDPEILSGYRRTFAHHQQSGIHSLLEVFQTASSAQTGQQQFDLDTATQGVEGVNMMKQAIEDQRPYSLLLLDMRMPEGWDGLRTAQEARKIDPQIRIIILSAFRDYTLSKMREEIGEHFVLHHKPYLQDELIQLTTFMAQEWQQAQCTRSTTSEITH